MKHFLILALLFVFSAHAKVVTPKASTPIYKKTQGKLKAVRMAKRGQKFRYLGRTKNRKYVRVAYNGKPAYMKSNRVAMLRGSREPSAYSQASVAVANKQQWLFHAGPALQSASFGLGLGAGASYMLDTKVLENKLEVAADLYFYPFLGTAGVGGSGLGFSASARTILYGSKLKGIGAEAGIAFMRASIGSISVPGFPGLTVPGSSSTSFGLLIGGIGRYPLTEKIFLNGGLRFYLMNGTPVQLHAGVAFSF